MVKEALTLLSVEKYENSSPAWFCKTDSENCSTTECSSSAGFLSSTATKSHDRLIKLLLESKAQATNFIIPLKSTFEFCKKWEKGAKIKVMRTWQKSKVDLFQDAIVWFVRWREVKTCLRHRFLVLDEVWIVDQTVKSKPCDEHLTLLKELSYCLCLKLQQRLRSSKIKGNLVPALDLTEDLTSSTRTINMKLWSWTEKQRTGK